MGWIADRIAAEYNKHYRMPVKDWTKISEAKIIGQLKENLDAIKQEGAKR